MFKMLKKKFLNPKGIEQDRYPNRWSVDRSVGYGLGEIGRAVSKDNENAPIKDFRVTTANNEQIYPPVIRNVEIGSSYGNEPGVYEFMDCLRKEEDSLLNNPEFLERHSLNKSVSDIKSDIEFLRKIMK